VLGGQGISSGQFVGVCLPRNAMLPVVLLALWKLGAAYVPLDPDFPLERLLYMVENSGMSSIISDTEYGDLLAAANGETSCLVYCLEDIIEQLHKQPVHLPEITINASDIAYIIYTSGSTGRPKGVVIDHGAVANFLLSMAQEPGLSADDVFVAMATISFDMSVLELFLPLVVGGCCYILPKEVTIDAALLSLAIAGSAATVVQATPSTWRMLLNSGWKGASALRLFTGGEALTSDLAEQLLSCGSELWNLYGPTETTVYSACIRVEPDCPMRIGRPIHNTQIYIFDDSCRLVAAGTYGEICIGGDGLAVGYHNQLELTQEKFIYTEDGVRLYRTGDIGRYLGDGNIEYAGRIDDQVKVRGFRIELREIEAWLIRHSGIDSSVVKDWRLRDGDVRLVAYITITADYTGDDAMLRGYLAEHLPDYMCPQHFVVLAQLPLTPNGKIDRKALPEPKLWQRSVDEHNNHCGDESEQALLHIWEKVLGVPSVGLDEDFLALGGHSLLLAEIAVLTSRHFGIVVPLRSVFEHTTVRSLARWCSEQRSETKTPVTVLEEDAFNICQRRFWYLDQLYGGFPAHNLPILLSFSGCVDEQKLAKSFQDIVACQPSLRSRFIVEDGRPVKVVEDSVDFHLDILDLRSQDESQVMETVAERIAEVFDLQHAPLIRATLIRRKTQQYDLLIVTHHIISDAWSNAILKTQLASCYRQRLAGGDTLLDLKEVKQQPASIDSALIEREAFWVEQLAGAEPVLNLPTDFVRPVVMTYQGARCQLKLSAQKVRQYRQLAQDRGVSLSMLLMSVYWWLLARYSGQTDIVIGVPVSASRVGNGDVIDCYIRTLPIRISLEMDVGFSELLQKVRGVVLEVLDHSDIPFERIVELINPPRSASRTPIYQVLFSFLDRKPEVVEWPGLECVEQSVPVQHVQTDFGLYLELEHDGGLTGYLEYSTDSYQQESATQYLSHYLNLLDGLLLEPNPNLAKGNLLSGSDCRRQLEDWNNTDLPLPSVGSVLGRIISWSQKNGEVPATESLNNALNYRELDEKSNQLAGYLAEQGVQAGQLVGVCVPRDEYLVVALLAVWKVGAAYVPLDEHYPAERLRYVIEHASLSRILTVSSLASSLSAGNADLIFIDDIASQLERINRQLPCPALSSSDLAYVIYTSGSTGKPKGVKISHGALLNFIESMSHKPGLVVQDRLLAVTTLSFDIAGLELFLPLYIGATCVIARREDVQDAVRLKELLVENKISVMQATPSMWRALLAVGWMGEKGFKILVGGEALSRDLAQQLIGSGDSVWNMYGPTETTIWSSCRKLSVDDDHISIGWPIANTQMYILDKNRQL
ncbi:MAG TPA: amino acid adenylation domain-containing protein, partial [Porticoccus sp.]|nr:amino acid adenylation domain-containing protein [Porticoccus sp.]